MNLFKKDQIQKIISTESDSDDPVVVQTNERILLVDDEKNNLVSLERMLEDQYQILTASSPKIAIDLLKSLDDPSDIKLIISDYMMPEMNGVDFLKEAAKISPKTVRVILTGYANVDSIVNAINEGQIYKFMLKPVDKNDLLITIKNGLHHAKLSKKNIELIEELKKLNEGLEINIQKETEKVRNLLRVVCHDISNPLMVSTHQMKKIVKLLPTQDPTITSARDKVMASLSAISDILTLVRDMQAIESHKIDINLEPIEVKEMEEHLRLVFDNAITKKDITLSITNNIPEGTRPLAETISLKNNVLSNLISNAIKFSNKGDEITITWAMAGDNNITVTIQDHGIGIPEEILNHLFDPDFKTSRLGTEGEKGTGFGMPIVKSYIERYGGQIQVSSKTKEEDAENHGTTFVITLPIAKQSAEEAA